MSESCHNYAQRVAKKGSVPRFSVPSAVNRTPPGPYSSVRDLGQQSANLRHPVAMRQLLTRALPPSKDAVLQREIDHDPDAASAIRKYYIALADACSKATFFDYAAASGGECRASQWNARSLMRSKALPPVRR